MRILAVLHSSDIGGAEVCYSRLLEALMRRGDVEVVGMYPPGPLVSEWEKTTQWRLYRAGSLGLRCGPKCLAKWWLASVLHSADIIAAAREWSPDVIVSLTSVLTTPSRVARHLGLPNVVYVREYVEPDAARARLWKRLARDADELIAVSSPLARDLEPYARGRVHMIHDGVPVPPLRKERQVGPRTVSFFGGYDPLKGADVFIEAVPRVSAEFPDARFALYGLIKPGQETFHGQLVRRAAELRLPVEFVQTASFEEGQSQATVAVVPSRLEGLGLVALECMSWGVPVVASDVGGLPDVVIPGETGLLVPPVNPEALGDAVATLLRDEPRRRRMGIAARSHVAQHFDPDASAAGLVAVAQAAIDRRGLAAGG